MTTTELKYSMVEMITKVADKSAIEELFQLISEFLSDLNQNFEAKMTPEQVEDLQESVEESFDTENLISHDSVMKKYEKWSTR